MSRMLIVALFLAFVACKDKSTKEAVASERPAVIGSDSTHYEYVARYSAKMTIEEPKYTEIVLKATRAWDNGQLMKVKELFSDTVYWNFANRLHLYGPRDSVLEAAQNIRQKFSRVESLFNAYVPVKTMEQNDIWVCLWKWEMVTDTNGKLDSTFMHEAWYINKNEKVQQINQYAMKW